MNFKNNTLTNIMLCATLSILIVGSTFLGSCSSDQNKFESAAVESDESTATLTTNLKNCEAYTEMFTHPFTGEEMKREVVGPDADGLCEYKEEMPNGGLMKCKYSEETRKVMAQYYEGVVLSGPSSMGLNTRTYTIDGKIVTNPLDEVMSNGDCSISGY